MKTAIITGTSRGLGKALAETFLKRDFLVISIARTTPDIEHDNFRHISFDLSEIQRFDTLFEQLGNLVPASDGEPVVLINNAGRLGIISKTEKYIPDDLSATFSLNTTAPMLLSSWVIRRFGSVPLQIIQISSGAAFNAHSGWGAYSATKAALESYTRTLALEYENNPLFRVLSIAPGVVDTAMQQQIREAKKEDFEQVERFIRLHTEHQLSSPEQVAEKLYRVYSDSSYKSGISLNLRDL